MIVITEKEKNLKTGVKNKQTVKVGLIGECLDTLNEWATIHLSEDSVVTTTFWRKKMKIGFTTVSGDYRYRLIFEWR